MAFEPQNPTFEDRVRRSFADQIIMEKLGAAMSICEAGRVVLEMAYNQDFTQQHGFLHAGTLTTLLDSAAGYAAFSLMPSAAEVLTIELKTSLMSPARGERFRFDGRVIKPGRTITFCEADAFALEGGHEKLIATLTATMMTVTGLKI